MSETSPQPTVWVFSPVFHDTECFKILRQDVVKAFEVIGISGSRVNFVAIDDTAGADAAVGELRALPNTTVVSPPFNLGHQRALVYGLRKRREAISERDLVVTLDADGEDQPRDLPRLLSPLLADESLRRIVLARRTRRRERLLFKIFYVLFKLFFRVLTGQVIRTGNFAAYRGWVVHNLLIHPYFDLCYSSTFMSLGLPFDFVPCERGTRYLGTSKMNVFRLIMHGFRMLMPFLDRIAMRALITFSITFSLGMALILVVVGVRVFTSLAIPGWATYTSLMILVLSFVALGNFLVLFTLFSQGQGVSLSFLDRTGNGGA